MDPMQDRRRHTRLLCADLIEVIWRDHTGEEKRRIANLEDISEKGMSLQLECAIHAGTPVRVLYGEVELRGLIRYAVYKNQAYFVGVELEEASRWSVRHFIPEHLFDPRKLLQRLRAPKAEPATRWVN
jgi:hypothetical protein